MRAGTARLRYAQGNVTRAAGHVQHLETPGTARRVDHGDEIILPQSVQPGRHQIVHLIITIGYPRKDLIDEPLLVFCRHFPEAEIDAVLRLPSCCHGAEL
jgi:hypothetical protein